MPKAGSRGKKGGPRRPRKRYVWMSVLNVNAHPHDEGANTYTKLWRAAADQGAAAKFYGDKVARIGSANSGVLGTGNAISGEIWTYTIVGGKGGVLKVKEKRIVDLSEVTLTTWEDLGFNPRTFHYTFLPDVHRVGFEWRGGMSPTFLRWTLQTILNAPGVLSAAGVTHVDVQLEQEESQLDQILALKLDELTVFLTKPNPDDLAGFQEEFRRNLAEQNAESQTLKLKADPGSQLAPSKSTEALAKLALSNGHVQGHGRDMASNKAKTLTTEETPIRKGDEWDPNAESLFQLLSRQTASIAAKIKARLRDDRDA